MKRQFESLEDSSCDSSSYENSTSTPTTNTSSSSSTTTIRNNNRSRRYVDNIIQAPPQPTTPLPNLHKNNSHRNNTPQDSFSFVNSTTKVPTNRRHLKLRKQLKQCTDFSASYFVLDVNAPAANTIGFMGSTRGNDIPVLLTDTVSNNNQPTVNSTPSNPPSRKKTKRESIDFVSNRKGGNKSWIASVNTTVSSSSNTVNSTTPTTTNSTQSNTPTTKTQQSFLQQLVNPMNSSSQMISIHPNTNNVLVPNTLPIINQQTPQPNQINISNNHLLSSMNSFQHQHQRQQNNIQSMMNPLSNMYTNGHSAVPQDSSYQIETLLNCFVNTLNNPLGQLQNYSNNSLDSSPITTPSTPSTNNGIASPIIGSLVNANLPQVNSYTNNGNSAGNSFGVQSFSQSNTNVTTNPEMVNRNQFLFDLLTHDEARILLNTLTYSQSNNH